MLNDSNRAAYAVRVESAEPGELFVSFNVVVIFISIIILSNVSSRFASKRARARSLVYLSLCNAILYLYSERDDYDIKAARLYSLRGTPTYRLKNK